MVFTIHKWTQLVLSFKTWILPMVSGISNVRIIVMYVANQYKHIEWHTFVTQVCLCFAIYGKHAIFLQICSKGGYLHLWLHNYNWSIIRLDVHSILWYRLIIPRGWTMVLLPIITWRPPTNPYELSLLLEFKLHWTSCLCYKHWEHMGSLGCNMPKY